MLLDRMDDIGQVIRQSGFLTGFQAKRQARTHRSSFFNLKIIEIDFVSVHFSEPSVIS
jgi:hypothetical protein